MEDQKRKVIDSLKQGTNILVTVRRDPSIDGLAAAIGLSLILNGVGKHATAVFSGTTPEVLEFLEPGKTLHKTTDSLQDFIISLDKAKADKLRYKVEDQFVKIFITPYKTALSDKDLQFGQGDFNVDVVVALGVHSQDEVDEAVTAHGRILHDATVVSLNVDTETVEDLGNINWVGSKMSGLSQMVLDLADDLIGEKKDVLDNQVATALLTGIVAETDRFSNSKTTPQVMQASARLLEAGANQELVASKLTETPKAEEQPAEDEAAAEAEAEPESESQPTTDESDGAHHEDNETEDKPDEKPDEKSDSDDKPDDDAHEDDDTKPEGDKPPDDEGSGDDGASPLEEGPDKEPEEPKPADDSFHVEHEEEQSEPTEEKDEDRQETHESAGSTTDATPADDVVASEDAAEKPVVTDEPATEETAQTESPSPVSWPVPEPDVPQVIEPEPVAESVSEPVAESEAAVEPLPLTVPDSEFGSVPEPQPVQTVQPDVEPQAAPEPPAVPDVAPDASQDETPALPSKYSRTEMKHELVLQPLSAGGQPGVSNVHRTLTPENDPMDETGMIGSALQAEAASREAAQPYDMNRISVPASIPMAPPVVPAAQAAWLPAPPAGAQYQQQFAAPASMPQLPPNMTAPAAGPSADEQAAMAILQHGRTDDIERTRIQPLRDQYSFASEPPLSDKKLAAANDLSGKSVDSSLDPTKFALSPPSLGGTLTAAHDSSTLDPATDPLSGHIIKHRPIMTHDPHEIAVTGTDELAPSMTDPESVPSGAAAPPHGGSSEPLAGVGHDITVPDSTTGVVNTEPEKPAPLPGLTSVADETDITAQLMAATAGLPEVPAEKADGQPAPILEAAIGEAAPAEAHAADPTPAVDEPAQDTGPSKPLEAAISNDEPQPTAEVKAESEEKEPEASSKPLEAAISNEAPAPEPKQEDDAKQDDTAGDNGPSKPLEAAISNDEPPANASAKPEPADGAEPAKSAGPSKPLEAALAA